MERRYFTFKRFHLLLIVLTGLMCLLFCVSVVRYLPVVGDNVYPEAAGVVSAHRLAQGHGLYADYRRSPYIVTAFPPFWYSALAGAAKLGFSNLDSLTLFGRIFSLVCLGGMLMLSYFWSRHVGVKRHLAIVAPLLLLSFPVLTPWAIAARPDFPGLLLALAALYCVATRTSRTSVVLGAVLAASAFLTRHNAVAVPTAIVLWLMWSRKWKRAVAFCAVWGIVVASAFVAVQKASDGLLGLNLSGAKFGSFALTYVRDVIGRLLESPGNGFAIVLLALGLLGLLQALRAGDARMRLATIYFVVACGFSFLGAAAAGAAVNHLLEPAFALTLMAPLGLERMESSWQDDSPAAIFAFTLIAVVLLPTLDVQRWNVMHNRPDDLRSFVPIVEKMQVFTDIPYLAARASSPEFLDTASLVYAERPGTQAAWSTDLANAFAQKKYDLIILSAPVEELYFKGGHYPRYPHLDSAVEAAISKNYVLCTASGAVYLYGPLTSDSRSSCASTANVAWMDVGS